MTIHDERPSHAVVTDHTHARTWLTASLVVAVLAAIGLGAWVYTDHYGIPGAQHSAVAAVTAQIEATNAHDVAAIQAVSATSPSWVYSLHGVPTSDPYVGADYFSQMQEQYTHGVHITTTGPTVALPDGSMVSVGAEVTFDGAEPSAGVLVFCLQDIDGAMKISHTVWMPNS